MTTKLFTLAALLFPMLAGCGADTLAVAGLRIEIRDGHTGAAAAHPAVVTVRDGSYTETIRGSDVIFSDHRAREAAVWAAYNRPGTYDVTVTHPDYQTWSQTGIRVRRSGDSSPFDGSPLSETVKVVARLLPLD